MTPLRRLASTWLGSFWISSCTEMMGSCRVSSSTRSHSPEGPCSRSSSGCGACACVACACVFGGGVTALPGDQLRRGACGTPVPGTRPPLAHAHLVLWALIHGDCKARCAFGGTSPLVWRAPVACAVLTRWGRPDRGRSRACPDVPCCRPWRRCLRSLNRIWRFLNPWRALVWPLLPCGRCCWGRHAR